MKASLLLLVCSASLSLAAELIPGNRENTASLEDRRANALSEKLARFETMKGRVYEDVRITGIDTGGVSLSHSSGTARLRYDDLSPTQRRYFGIDETAATETYRKEALARAAYEKRVQEKQIARRAVAEKEAEAHRLAEEKATAARALAEANRPPAPTEIIPARPTIQRIDTSPRRVRYSTYGSSYGYHPYSYYRPTYRSGHYSSGYHFGNTGCRTGTPGFTIRF